LKYHGEAPSTSPNDCSLSNVPPYIPLQSSTYCVHSNVGGDSHVTVFQSDKTVSELVEKDGRGRRGIQQYAEEGKLCAGVIPTKE
jgi:hypothetical protein